jgi:hypothetical protein
VATRVLLLRLRLFFAITAKMNHRTGEDIPLCFAICFVILLAEIAVLVTITGRIVILTCYLENETSSSTYVGINREYETNSSTYVGINREHDDLLRRVNNGVYFAFDDYNQDAGEDLVACLDGCYTNYDSTTKLKKSEIVGFLHCMNACACDEWLVLRKIIGSLEYCTLNVNTDCGRIVHRICWGKPAGDISFIDNETRADEIVKTLSVSGFCDAFCDGGGYFIGTPGKFLNRGCLFCSLD